MKAGELLKLIPAELFQELAVETRVDTQVKKLPGEVIFKLILFSMLNSERLSLRVMETYLQSAQFKSFTNYDILEGKYNSIRDRICTINAGYFEKLFESIFSIFNRQLKEEKSITKTDSTYVALATRLFSEGIKTGDKDRRFVKYTVNLKGSFPSSVKVFTAQTYVSEDVALSEVINQSEDLSGNVVVFDRGIQSRKSFDSFTDSNKWFITRSKLDISYKTVQSLKIPSKPSGSTVTIISDQVVKLSNSYKKPSDHLYRVIHAVIDVDSKPICFVSNLLNEDPYQLAAWYKQRWEIEVFFKFIKQHLNVNHLVSGDENGIKVMIYMTMILAILIIAYKKLNGLKGYKIPKLKFELELDQEIIKEIVLLCGGDPSKAPHVFSSA